MPLGGAARRGRVESLECTREVRERMRSHAEREADAVTLDAIPRSRVLAHSQPTSATRHLALDEKISGYCVVAFHVCGICACRKR